MKKAIMSITIWTMLVMSCYAPEMRCIYIENAPIIKKFDPLLYSFQKIESNFDEDVVNYLGYTGMLQIGKEMVMEANRINKMNGNPIRFTFPASALDSLQSVKIWYTVQTYWNPKYELKRACHIWNPLASSKYYYKIKSAYLTIKQTKL